MSASGNCHKVRLMLELLGEEYQWHEVDSVNGGTRTPEFLAMNPNGKVPLLEFAAGRYLPESNAILFYLAEGTPFWPEERLARARALEWMFFEQYSHEPYIAVARMIMRFLPADHPRRAELPMLLERGNHALGVMERHLSGNPYFAGNDCSIADIALYAYTHCAGEAGFMLERFPAVQEWIGRLEGRHGFRPIR